MLTALRGGQPDRVPLPLRMWKFLRKYYSDTGDPLDKALRAHDEFGIDLWHLCTVAHPTLLLTYLPALARRYLRENRSRGS